LTLDAACLAADWTEVCAAMADIAPISFFVSVSAGVGK
jgi:hypothetical protein